MGGHRRAVGVAVDGAGVGIAKVVAVGVVAIGAAVGPLAPPKPGHECRDRKKREAANGDVYWKYYRKIGLYSSFHI